MRPPPATPLTLKSKDALALSAILMKPRNALASFVFAHGAGDGMTHPFMDPERNGVVAPPAGPEGRSRFQKNADLGKGASYF
jgi:hypothetical protein